MKIAVMLNGLAAAGMVLAFGTAAGAQTTMTGKTFEQMQEEYPDMDIVEFRILDTNGDGLIDELEAEKIGDEEDDRLDPDDDS